MGSSRSDWIGIGGLGLAAVALVATLASVPALQPLIGNPFGSKEQKAPPPIVSPSTEKAPIKPAAKAPLPRRSSAERDNGGCRTVPGQWDVVVLPERTNFTPKSLPLLQTSLPCAKFRLRWGKTLAPGNPINIVGWSDARISDEEGQAIVDALSRLGVRSEPVHYPQGVIPPGTIWLAYVFNPNEQMVTPLASR